MIAGVLLAGCQNQPQVAIEPSEYFGAQVAGPGADPPEELPFGTRERAYPVGAPFRVGDWSVTVESVIDDADALVLESQSFNNPPQEGYRFVLWRVTLTYLGDGTRLPGIDLTWSLVGSAGNSFGTIGSCGTIPDSITGRGEMSAGDTVTGNLCASALSEQVKGSTISVRTSAGGSEERAFVALP